MSKADRLVKKYSQISTSPRSRKYLLPSIDKKLDEITNKWLKKKVAKISASQKRRRKLP